MRCTLLLRVVIGSRRLRPDKNLMEQGDWDAANDVKLQLEDAQRVRRRAMEKGGVAHKPMWFERKFDPVIPGRPVYLYKVRIARGIDDCICIKE